MSTIKTPMYRVIYDDIVKRIRNGEYKDNDQLPSENDLANSYHVSRITSKKVFEMLASDGLIERIQGKGSFIRLSAEPNGASKKRTLKIGVVVDNITSEFSKPVFLAIEKMAEESDFYIIPRFSYGKRDLEEKAIQFLLGMEVDGIIVMSSHSEDISLVLLKMVLENIPLVLVDRFLNGIPAPYVGSNNCVAAIRATDYLFDLGHRNIGFLTRPYGDNYVLSERMSGYIRSHAEHGIAIENSISITDIASVIPGYETEEKRREDIQKVKRLLSTRKEVTCIMAAEYNIGLIAKAAAEELGLRIPQDLSLLCFDGKGDLWNPCFFTHVRQRSEEIGTKAVELLMNQIRNSKDDGNNKFFFDSDLVLGQSTAPARR